MEEDLAVHHLGNRNQEIGIMKDESKNQAEHLTVEVCPEAGPEIAGTDHIEG